MSPKQSVLRSRVEQVHLQLVKKSEALHPFLIQVDLMCALHCMEITHLFNLAFIFSPCYEFYVISFG